MVRAYVCMKISEYPPPPLGFSGDRKIPTRGPTVPGLPSFPLNGGPEGWDFSGTTEHQWSILFLIYHDRTVQYCVIFVGDVTHRYHTEFLDADIFLLVYSVLVHNYSLPVW